ncbi:MAG: HAD family phosphatase [Bacteroidetes bacterium]|nr:MAG: HAD family phosphatase [Bacteroidota bacterium]
MIKLIAIDLDGTLLDDKKQIHPEFWKVNKKLTESGVLFVAASGRQYHTLYKQFERIIDKIVILAENGTFVKFGNEELLVNSLPLDKARYFIKKGRSIPNTEIILCGKSSAYIESNNEIFRDDAAQYYARLKKVDDLCKVDDSLLKVTLWEPDSAEQNAYPHFKSYLNDYKIAVAGDVWLDITHQTASKGTAIEKIQKKYDISPEETLIFGDYLNDLDMMGVGYYSYAMKNAHPKIKEISRFTTRYDNNNNGVVKTIKELFNLV